MTHSDFHNSQIKCVHDDASLSCDILQNNIRKGGIYWND